ncbi:protein of unknown function DUF250 [Cynara cardunculus var. scolymus]|uniref:Uncharacterized protein n=1 Tax=Cynara cardunculus var. scolymus TaxID=59895 RepID=A0A103XEL4_CYNCS|nr:protein of unknown function DUF250 [Cynara cardunculus var. scolymus]
MSTPRTLGVVGLIFVVSSLFSNVISTLSHALTPLPATVVFHENMNRLKVIAVLMGLWGVSTYIYQNYLDDLRMKRKQRDANANGTQHMGMFSVKLAVYEIVSMIRPLAAVVVFHKNLNGLKVITMLMGLWGFSTYIYQNYLDDLRMKGKQRDVNANGMQCTSSS